MNSKLFNAAMLVLMTQKIMASQKAFVMLEEVEEEKAPYEPVLLDNISNQVYRTARDRLTPS